VVLSVAGLRLRQPKLTEHGPWENMPFLSIDTVLPADSVEFCPHPDASNILVCGTYKLQDNQNPQPSGSDSPSQSPAGQIRTGQCLVFEVDSSGQDISACAVPFLCVETKLRGSLFFF